MRKLSMFLVLFGLAGCTINPSKNADPITVTGTVSQDGKPVSDVVIQFQATGAGAQASMPVKNGEFTGSIIPGKYTYYFTESSAKPAGFRSIPEGFRSGSMDRQIEIKDGSRITIDIN